MSKTTSTAAINYVSLSLKELKALATKRNIVVTGKKKSDYLAAFEAFEKTNKKPSLQEWVLGIPEVNKKILKDLLKASFTKERGDMAGSKVISDRYMKYIAERYKNIPEAYKYIGNWAVSYGFLSFKKYEPNELNKGKGGIIWLPTKLLVEAVNYLK